MKNGAAMKQLLTGSIFTLARLLGTDSTVKAAEFACEPPSAAWSRAQFGSQQAGGNALRLGSDQAERFSLLSQ